MILSAAQKGLKQVVEVLLPPRCYACGELTADHGQLCSECWGELDFIAPPACDRCGEPFEHNYRDAKRCMTCMLEPPPFEVAQAVFRYGGASKKLVTGYKFHDRTLATPMLTGWLARAGAGVIAESEVLIPVPLHRWRLLKRRYNQSALLAGMLGKQAGKTVWVDGLIRTRHTPQQAGLTREEREANVKDVFTVSEKYRQAIENKKILLIDDVMTTGATIRACTLALKEAGASEVRVLTLARTVLDD